MPREQINRCPPSRPLLPLSPSVGRKWGSAVSREELVEQYLDGQLSRRVFIRRLIATGVTTAAAFSYASLLESSPAAAAAGDFYLTIQDYYFSVTPARLAFGQSAEFANQSRSGHRHSATDSSGMGLFDTGRLPRHSSGRVTLPSAGSYPYRCSEPSTTHPRMNGQLRAPLQITPARGTSATTFTVRWAPARLPIGYVVDVQRRAPGSTTWTNWRSGATGTSSTFRTSTRGRWSYRARLRRTSNGAASGWSETVSVTVS